MYAQHVRNVPHGTLWWLEHTHEITFRHIPTNVANVLFTVMQKSDSGISSISCQNAKRLRVSQSQNIHRSTNVGCMNFLYFLTRCKASRSQSESEYSPLYKVRFGNFQFFRPKHKASRSQRIYHQKHGTVQYSAIYGRSPGERLRSKFDFPTQERNILCCYASHPCKFVWFGTALACAFKSNQSLVYVVGGAESKVGFMV